MGGGLGLGCVEGWEWDGAASMKHLCCIHAASMLQLAIPSHTAAPQPHPLAPHPLVHTHHVDDKISAIHPRLDNPHSLGRLYPSPTGDSEGDG